MASRRPYAPGVDAIGPFGMRLSSRSRGIIEPVSNVAQTVTGFPGQRTRSPTGGPRGTAGADAWMGSRQSDQPQFVALEDLRKAHLFELLMLDIVILEQHRYEPQPSGDPLLERPGTA